MMYKPAVLSSREYNDNTICNNSKSSDYNTIVSKNAKNKSNNNNNNNESNNNINSNKDKSMTPSFSFSKELQLLKMSARSVPSTLLLSPPEEPAKPCKIRRGRNSSKKTPYCLNTLETAEFVGEEVSKWSSDRECRTVQNLSLGGSSNTTHHTLPMLSNQTAPSLPNLLPSPLMKNDKQRNNCEAQVHWLDQDLSLDLGFSVKNVKEASLSNITCESSTMTTESPRKRPLTLLERRRSSRGKLTELSGLCMEAITSPTEMEVPTLTTPPHVTFRGWTKASRSRMTSANTSSTSSLHQQHYFCEEHFNTSTSNEANVHCNDEARMNKVKIDTELETKHECKMTKQLETIESTLDAHEFTQQPHLSSSWQTSVDCEEEVISTNMIRSTFSSNTNNGYGFESQKDINTAIRVVCYNILADRLVNTDRYRSCPMHVLNEEYRIALIKEEVKLAAPDIFIAEEISESVFHKTDSLGDFLRNELHLHGELITITDMSGNPHHRALESQSLSQTWLPAEWERDPKVNGVEPVIVPIYDSAINTVNEFATQYERKKINSSTKSKKNNLISNGNNDDKVKELCGDNLIEKSQELSANDGNDSVTYTAAASATMNNNDANDSCIDYKDACDAMCDSPLVLSSFRLNRKYEHDGSTEVQVGNTEKSSSNYHKVHNSEAATIKTNSGKLIDSSVNCSAIANEQNDSMVEDDSSMLRSEMDGVAIFFNSNRFTLLEKVPIYFNRIAMEESHLLTAYERRKLRVNSHNVAMICVLKDRHVPTHIYLVAAVHLIWHREECQMWQCHHLLNTLERLKAKYSAMTSTSTIETTEEEGNANTWEENEEECKYENQEQKEDDSAKEQSCLYHVTCIIGGDYNVERSSAVFDYLQHGTLHKTANVFQSWQQALRQDADEHSMYTDSFEMNSIHYTSKEDGCYSKDKHKSKETIIDKKPSFMTTEALEQLERNNANDEYETRRATSLNYANYTSMETSSLPCPLAVHTPLAAFARKSRRARNDTNSTVNTNEIESDGAAVLTTHDTTTNTTSSENTAFVSATATKSGVESELGEETSSECYQESQFSMLSCDNPLCNSNHTPSSNTRHECKMYSQTKSTNVELPNLHLPSSRSVTPTMLNITPIISPTCVSSNTTKANGANNSLEGQSVNTMLASLYSASPHRNNSITCNELCKDLHSEHQHTCHHQPQASTNGQINTTNTSSSSYFNSTVNTANMTNTSLLCSSPLSQPSQISHSRRHWGVATNATTQAALESSVKRQSSIEMEVVGHSLLRSPHVDLQLPSPNLSHRLSARTFLPIPVTPSNLSPPISLTLQSPSSIASSQQTSPVPVLRSSHSTTTNKKTRTTRPVKLSLSATATASTAVKIVKIAQSRTSPHHIQRTPSLEPALLSSFTPSQRSVSVVQPSPQLLPESIYMPMITERAVSNNILPDNVTSQSETPINSDKGKFHSSHGEIAKGANNKSNCPPLLITPLLTSSMTSMQRFMSLPSPSSLLPPPSHVAQATLSPSSPPFCIHDYNASFNKVNGIGDATSVTNECAIRSPSIECVPHICNANKADNIYIQNNKKSNNNNNHKRTTNLERNHMDENCIEGKNKALEVEHASTPFSHMLSFSDAYAYYCRRHRTKVSAVQPPSMNEGKVIDHILYENKYIMCVGVLRLGNVAAIPSPTIPSDHYMIGAIFTPVQVELTAKQREIIRTQQKQSPGIPQKQHTVGNIKQKRMLASTVREQEHSQKQ